jgi:POT family proton-dependent oligopeptide transporter
LFLYIGIGFLIIGNGLFKPNMTSIISNAYHNHPEKRRCLFNVLYGCECSALGIMLCGYMVEKFLELGFGLAGFLFECYSSILLRTYLEILV